VASGRRVLLVLVGLQLARGLLYALLIPLWQNPDELSHFEYVELLARGGAIHLDLPLQESMAYRVLAALGYQGPTPGTELTHSALRAEISESLARHRFWEIRPAADRLEPFRNRELDQPPLYYFGAAQVVRWLRPGNLEGDAYALRLVNVVLALGVVAITYRVGGELFPERPVLAIAPAAFIAGLPQYAALSASVTNDKLIDLILAGIILVVVRAMRCGLSRWGMAGLVVLTLMGLLTKATGVFAAPILLAGWAVSRARRQGRSVSRYVLVRSLLLAGLATPLFTSGERLRRLWRMFLGFLGYWFPGLLSSASAPGWKRLVPIDSLVAAITYRLEFLPIQLAWLRRYVAVLFTGFWGNFGHMEAPLPMWLYALLGAASGAAALGLLLVLARVVPPDRLGLPPGQQWMVVFFLAAVFWVTLLLFVRDGLVNSFSQGRHLFPVLVPAAALFVVGLRSVIPRIDDRHLVVGIVLGLALLDALSLVTTVIPFFYGVAFAAVR
jgi:Dolichyl-phosphate-mannose-protein mannosyltransferase